MSTELTLLAYAVGLLFILILIQSTAGILAQGAAAMMGPRDHLKAPSLWQARTKRVVDNHREGLLLFAPLVLSAHVQNISSDMTVLGAEMFFYARVAHAISYLAGAPYVRPAFWLVGIAGTVIIFLALFGLV